MKQIRKYSVYLILPLLLVLFTATTCNDDEIGHYELAKALYNFVKADATEFEFHYSFWSNGNKWTTEAERTTMTAAIEARVKTYLGVTGEDTLASLYNVKVTPYTATGTKVVNLGEETRALRNGKGNESIIIFSWYTFRAFSRGLCCNARRLLFRRQTYRPAS